MEAKRISTIERTIMSVSGLEHLNRVSLAKKHVTQSSSSSSCSAWRRPSRTDRWLSQIDHAISVLTHDHINTYNDDTRLYQDRSHLDASLQNISTPQTHLNPSSIENAQHTARLMRINHVGEVCAQALYQGQAMATNNLYLRKHLLEAADEEIDHLVWCQKRIRELGGRTSYLNPLWYGASWVIGYALGRCGDAISLAFLHETERQVGEHIQHHQRMIPISDIKTHEILKRMHEDELQHAQKAAEQTDYRLPWACSIGMRWLSRIMTFISSRL